MGTWNKNAPRSTSGSPTIHSKSNPGRAIHGAGSSHHGATLLFAVLGKGW